MLEVPQALAAMASYKQFILWKIAERKGKRIKLPISPHTFQSCNAHDPGQWVTASEAVGAANGVQGEYGIGFTFTADDPFFFLDIDKCLLPSGEWSPLANTLCSYLPGAAIEVSQSGMSLHVFGMSRPVDHACKNTGLDIELYTEKRFVALTGNKIQGDAGLDFSEALAYIAPTYFPPRGSGIAVEWSSEPDPAWSGPTDDAELIERARQSQSKAAKLGSGLTFAQLWDRDVDALSRAFPDAEREFDESSADASLAQHLAFWTGNDSERILRVMMSSGLVREKWDREDYLFRTISQAVSMQTTFYRDKVVDTVGAANDAPELKASSDKQRDYAANVRAQALIACQGDQSTIDRLCGQTGVQATAKFWLDNQDKTPQELADMVTQVTKAPKPLETGTDGPVIVSGYRLMTATMQTEYFDGCVYIVELHKIFTPGGSLLKPDQFTATYGGYEFQLDDACSKTTRKAWEAFTISQVIQWPKAEGMCFRPELETGVIVIEEGRALVNVYVPIQVEMTVGDPSPVLELIKKLLPDDRDNLILTSFMAACKQYPGHKFQWAPLIQGVEGNGKTLLTRCVAHAIGNRYTHLPPANEISEKFNEWLFYKLFIGIEDVYVPSHKMEVIEVLKPMITNDRLAMRAMQQSQVMGDNRANFMLNTNHRDALRKSRNDRRFAIFYTAQQTVDDLVRDGMDGEYFPNLYRWLREGGYAIMAHYLQNFQIPAEFNPAGACHRAPKTSTTDQAIEATLGGIEQEILEAMAQGLPGFAGGWASSIAIAKLLKELHAERSVPINKRRDMMRSLGYDYHPALTKGRVNNKVRPDDGKPHLYIHEKSISRQLETPADVEKSYEAAQTMNSKAADIFGGASRDMPTT